MDRMREIDCMGIVNVLVNFRTVNGSHNEFRLHQVLRNNFTPTVNTHVSQF